MRGFLASSIGVTCAAALALPLAPPAAAAATSAAEPTTGRTARSEAHVPGSTQSLPLAPLTHNRAPGAAEQGVPRRDVRHFSLVGVVWDNPDTDLHGHVQVRTRATATGTWSGWQELETHNADHAADPGTPESTSGRVRGATAPLWVGESDGVEVRVRAERIPEAVKAAEATEAAASPLPTGMRLELVDPGQATPPPAAPGPEEGPRTTAMTAESAKAVAASAVNAGLAPLGATEIPAAGQRAKPYVGPRPSITTRRGWGADESLRDRKFVYTKKVKAAFVHHSATGNNYTCKQAPSVIRSIYRYHVNSMGWRDLGYNFLVDKCGKIYEGRAGGVSKAVLGAHTLGFNSNSMGIAVLGTYSSKKPSSAAVKAVARLTAWKLGLNGMNPRGKTYLKSGGGNLYRKGKNVRLNVISGHRDGFATSCPGKALYGKLGTTRSTAAKYQGR
ncbi:MULTISPECIES: peptidoglycan recognition protein family protein [unclassified Streptomyces]|uniref:peptidoglycan recognition protein family protein n=1 Tax=unclassified Streptomyces TaxID=2593676 RepID=UPI002441DF97|nr:peptidoglycan recognition protein [Streptomyces sp. DH41]MDG9724881.1 peptidoglycan recognition protein [Streptomyces sp. DH41]